MQPAHNKRSEGMHMTTISVIIGSTRQGRFSEKPAQWILQEFRRREGIEARILDLRDFPMPFFDQPVPPAMPKNAIDWVYPEWNRKPAAFVSYGGAMGVRAVQQLRETAVEVQMAPIRSAVHIPPATLWAHFQGGDVEKGLAELTKQANAMIDDLLWWTTALKTARGAAK